MNRAIEVNYTASPTGWKFHQSDKFVRGFMGPVGSGKSVTCCTEIYRRAMEQQPGPDGVARSRWAVVRNTYRELEDTTIKTWLDWFPESVFGPVNGQKMMHRLQCRNAKGVITHELEVLFRALDKPSDIKKLLSMELTGAWLNEAREIAQPIKDALETRLGRYPAKRDGGPTWHGLIMDTNPPDDDHWWYRLAEEETPDNHEFWRQPSGLSDAAENIDHLPDGYYENLRQKSADFVKVYVKGEYGYVQEGKPVYPEYSQSLHELPKDIPHDNRLTLIIGLDFGLIPAAVFLQQSFNGNWVCLDEYVDDNLSTKEFALAVKRKIDRDFSGCDYVAWGDPAGDSRSPGSDSKSTAFQILAANGLMASPSPDRSNNIAKRVDAVKDCLGKIRDGRPRLMINPKCRTLKKGMAGKYQYRRINVGGGERFHEKPDKNDFSHVNDALQYALLGGGENPTVNSKNSTNVKVHRSITPPLGNRLPQPGRTRVRR